MPLAASKPHRKQLLVVISQARTALAQAGAFSEDYIKNASFEDKNRIANDADSPADIKQCRAVLEDNCWFLRVENLQKILGWARRPNAQLQFELSFGDGKIIVAKDDVSHSIIIPTALRTRMPPRFELP